MAFFLFTIKNHSARKVAIFFVSFALFVLLGFALIKGDAAINYNHKINQFLEYFIMISDYILLGVIFYIGYKYKNNLIILFSLLQGILIFMFEKTNPHIEIENSIYIDHLTLIMLLLINIVGPLIAIFALNYMKEHEHHLHLTNTKQHIFFGVISLFLGAMNGIVLSNNIMWIYFFWEITTLCSFLLISHDKTSEAIKNGIRALLLNSLGGLAFVIGIILTYKYAHTLEMDKLIKIGDASLLFIPIAFLVFAGATKSAQFPFQSWLLGAMVAPTPVSALLHSSTMVKAGVYLILRLSPVYIEGWLGAIVAIFGAWTFVSGALLAITQSNAKRVLAYSTISNLGLIIVLSSIANVYAIYAAALLIVLHGISKALLFLCVGSIEQNIGSRDIEDMDGILTKMPIIAKLSILGAVSMLLPPFGVLITKWVAIEVAVQNPIALILIIFGSAFTVVFWSKFIGKLISKDKKAEKIEKFQFLTHVPLIVISFFVVFVSVFLIDFSNIFIAPFIKLAYARFTGIEQAAIESIKINDIFGYNPIIFFAILGGAILVSLIIYFIFKPRRYVCSYMAAENDEEGTFLTAMDTKEQVVFKNYYLTDIFSEKKYTLIANLASIALIVIMFGVILK